MHGDGLRTLLTTLDPKARDDLRRALIRDQAGRDAVSSQLLRYRDGHGGGWADIIDNADDASGGTAEGAAAARRDRGCRATLGRTGQAGERRGTRPSFASLGTLRPALESQGTAAARDRTAWR